MILLTYPALLLFLLGNPNHLLGKNLELTLNFFPAKTVLDNDTPIYIPPNILIKRQKS
jgi:hypothetical protein